MFCIYPMITQLKTLPSVKNDNKDEDCDDDYINNNYNNIIVMGLMVMMMPKWKH